MAGFLDPESNFKFWSSWTILLISHDYFFIYVVSAYAPQCGRSEEVKDEFWDTFIGVIGLLPRDQLVWVGGDLNGHVGKEAGAFYGVHGGYGFGE